MNKTLFIVLGLAFSTLIFGCGKTEDQRTTERTYKQIPVSKLIELTTDADPATGIMAASGLLAIRNEQANARLDSLFDDELVLTSVKEFTCQRTRSDKSEAYLAANPQMVVQKFYDSEESPFVMSRFMGAKPETHKAIIAQVTKAADDKEDIEYYLEAMTAMARTVKYLSEKDMPKETRKNYMVAFNNYRAKLSAKVGRDTYRADKIQLLQQAIDDLK